MKWLDLSKYGLHLVPVTLKNGKIALVMMGINAAENSKYKESLRKLRFSSSSKNFWFSVKYSNGKGEIKGIKPSEFKVHFPDLQVREMTTQEISRPWLFVDKQSLTKSFKNTNNTMLDRGSAKRIEIDLNQITPLGMNPDNEKVYMHAGERFVVDALGTKVYEKNNYNANAKFLRAGTMDNVKGQVLVDCTYGMLEQIKQGAIMGISDLENSVKVFFDIPDLTKIESYTKRSLIKIVQLAVDSAIFSKAEDVLYKYADIGDKTLQEVAALYERRPTQLNETRWHRDLPPEFALVVNKLIKDEHKNILLPFANKGGNILSVANKAGDRNVRALMDSNSPAFSEYLSLGKALNITYDKFNYVNDNLPDKTYDFICGSMPCQKDNVVFLIDNIKVSRIDHEYAFKILNSLTENGVGVISLDADDLNGEIDRKHIGFYQWLYNNFKVDTVVDLDGGLYSRMGDYSSSRLIVITGRLLVPIKTTVPDNVPILHKKSSVFELFEAIAERIHGVDIPISSSDEINIETLSQAMKRINEGRGDNIQLNDYQARYISMSSLKEAESMIPKNVSNSVRMCFARFIKDCGKADDFVMNKLQMTEDQIMVAFSAEQIDSIALSIWRYEFKNKAFLVADQTGKGKGRVLAGLMRYSILQDKKVIFVTEGANLFQDIWRDITDIDTQDIIDPYIVNNAATIINQEGVILTKGSNQKNKVYIQHNQAPTQNVIMTTYSQFSRKQKTEILNGQAYTPPNKSDWHIKLANNALVILDESHLASGQSNTNKIARKMLDTSSMQIYSSATFAKHAKNMSIYRELFPETLTTDEIQTALIKGKEPLQEILSTMLVADGGMLRREHDLSRVTVNTRKSNSYQERNIIAGDAFAQFLSSFAVLTGDIDEAAEIVNKKMVTALLNNPGSKMPSKKNVGYQSMSFGSQLHNLTKQFVLALNIDDAADAAIESYKQGRKPVIAIENTGGSLLQHLKEQEDDEPVYYETPPTIRDMLKRVVQRNMMILHTSPTGKKSYISASELYTDPNKKQAIEALYQQLIADIDNIPPLSFSPIDTLIEKLTKEHIKVGEISGRGLHLIKEEKGYRIVRRQKTTKNDTVNQFNEGYIDALIGTKSAATGLSLHSYKGFGDTSQRELIEAQVFDNIIDRMQMLGRVNRHGQVNDPILTCIDSMMPCETRILAMNNNKLAKMSANTTANQDNSAHIDTIDILNEVGDVVCQRYLQSNPILRQQLHLSEDDISDNNLHQGYESSLSRKFTSRLLMLNTKEQTEIYEDLDFEFQAYISECESLGYNPLRRKELDVGAKEIKRQRFQGKTQTFYESEFDRPTEIVTINYDVNIKALTTTTVLNMLKNGHRSVYSDSRVDAEDECLIGLVNELNKVEKSLIIATFNYEEKQYCYANPTFYKNILDDRMNQKYSNSTQIFVDRFFWLKNTLNTLTVGNLINLSTFSGDANGVITSIRLPRHGSEYLMSQYELTIATPELGLLKRSLADIYMGEHNIISSDEFDKNHSLAFKFDKTKSMIYKEERHLLAGNMFEAARFAAIKQIGTPVIYVDNTGARHSGVLLSKKFTPNEIMNLPFIMDEYKAIADYLRCHTYTKLSNALEYKHTRDISLISGRDNEKFKFIVPNNKANGEALFSNGRLNALTTSGFSRSRSTQTATIREQDLDAFTKELYRLGYKFYSENNSRKWLLDYKEGKVNIQNSDPAQIITKIN